MRGLYHASGSPHGEVLCVCKASNHEGKTRCFGATTSWFEAALCFAPHHEVHLIFRGHFDV